MLLQGKLLELHQIKSNGRVAQNQIYQIKSNQIYQRGSKLKLLSVAHPHLTNAPSGALLEHWSSMIEHHCPIKQKLFSSPSCHISSILGYAQGRPGGYPQYWGARSSRRTCGRLPFFWGLGKFVWCQYWKTLLLRIGETDLRIVKLIWCQDWGNSFDVVLENFISGDWGNSFEDRIGKLLLRIGEILF